MGVKGTSEDLIYKDCRFSTNFWYHLFSKGWFLKTVKILQTNSILNYFIPHGLRILCASLFFLYSSPVHADWHKDYTGTLGDRKIGLTITKKNISESDEKPNQITALHYFFHSNLKDIPLRLTRKEGRDLIFEEYDAQETLIGKFKLSFAKQDPLNRFKSKDPLREEVLTGRWISADEKSKFPVYLALTHEVSGSADDGRCYLTGDDYRKLQERVRRFHEAVVNQDTKTLATDFSYKAPTSQKWLNWMSNSVPHDLFCNWQGYMLGSGIAWFDESGKVISKGAK